MEPPDWANHIALKRCPGSLGQFKEQRDSAMAAYLTHRYRGLAVLVRSYSLWRIYKCL
jgi:hypothetical protein